MNRLICLITMMLLTTIAQSARAQLPPPDANGIVDLNHRSVDITTVATLSSNTTIRNGTLVNRTGTPYIARFAPGATDITIDNVTFAGGGVRGTEGISFANLRIVNSMFHSFNPGSVGAAIYITKPTDTLVIRNCTFRDAPSAWALQLYYINKLLVTRNTFVNVMQGGHFLDLRDDCTISHNLLRQIRRMGFEIQDLDWTRDPPGRRITVEHNAIYDFRDPYHSTFGLSVVRQNAYDTVIRNNYVRADSVPASGNRYGIGIETSWRTDRNDPQTNQPTRSVCENNTVIGPWYGHVVLYWRGQVIRNNRLFGNPAAGAQHIMNWRGHGGASDQSGVSGNVIERDLSKAPPPPTNAGAGSEPTTPQTPPTTVPTTQSSANRITIILPPGIEVEIVRR
jgi:hypothetical protein